MDKYSGTSDPEYVSLIFGKICRLYMSEELCNGTDSQNIIKLKPHIRNKRLAGVVVLGIAAGIAATIGAGLVIKSQVELHALQKSMDLVQRSMITMNTNMVAITKEITKLSYATGNITLHVAQELRSVYTIIERMRCLNSANKKALEYMMGVHTYRQYLSQALHHVVQTSITGKLTPSFLGMNELKKALADQPALQDTLIAKQPSLAYQFGRVYPAYVDFQDLRFGYILEVPAATMKHTYTLYKTYSVGYHHLSPLERRVERRRRDNYVTVYRPRLPAYAVLKEREPATLVALRHTQCEQGQGILMCRPSAIDQTLHDDPCLNMFLPNKAKDACLMCLKQAFEIQERRGTHEVLDTPAGTLVRALNTPVVAFPELPKVGGNAHGHVMKASRGSTFFVDYMRYKSFTVGGNNSYATQGSNLHAVAFTTAPLKFHDPSAFNLNQEVAEPVDLGLGRNFTTLREKLIQHHPILNVEPLTFTSFFTGLVGLVLILGAIILAVHLFKWGHCYCQENTARQPVRQAPFGMLRRQVAETERLIQQVDENIAMGQVGFRHSVSNALQEIKDTIEQQGTIFAKEISDLRGSLPTMFTYFDMRQYVNWHTYATEKVIDSDRRAHRITEPEAAMAASAMQPARQTSATDANTSLQPIRRSRNRSHSPDRRERRHRNASRTKAKTSDEHLEINLITAGNSADPSQPTNYWDTVPTTSELYISPQAAEQMKAQVKASMDDSSNKLFNCFGVTAGVIAAQTKALIDTGSDISYISLSKARQIDAAILPWSDKYAPILTADRMPMRIHGFVRILFNISGQLYPCVFFIPTWTLGTTGRYHVLIGNDLLYRIGKLVVDYKKRLLTLIDKDRKCAYDFGLTQGTNDLIISPPEGQEEDVFHVGEPRQKPIPGTAQFPPLASPQRPGNQSPLEVPSEADWSDMTTYPANGQKQQRRSPTQQYGSRRSTENKTPSIHGSQGLRYSPYSTQASPTEKTPIYPSKQKYHKFIR